MKIFHGGCHGCTNQVKYGLGKCKQCQYYGDGKTVDWNKPNMFKDSSVDVRDKIIKEMGNRMAVAHDKMAFDAISKGYHQETTEINFRGRHVTIGGPRRDLGIPVGTLYNVPINLHNYPNTVERRELSFREKLQKEVTEWLC